MQYVAFGLLLCLAILSVWRPSIAVAGAICTYGFEQWAQAKIPFFGQHDRFVNYAMAVIVLAALVVAALRGRNPLKPWPAVTYGVMLLFGYALLSTIWSVNPGISSTQFTRAVPYLGLFVVLVPCLITRVEDLTICLKSTLLIGSILTVLILLTTRIENRSIVLETGLASSTADVDRGNPLAIATMASHTLLIAVLMNFSNSSRLWLVLRWMTVPCGLFLALQSGSRGQVFAVFVLTLVLLPVSRGAKQLKGVFATGIAALCFVPVAYLGYKQFATSDRWDWGNLAENYSETRLGMSLNLLDYWVHSSPIRLIIGLGTSASYDQRIVGGYPHVVALEVLAELGTVGFLLFAGIICLTLISLLRIYRAQSAESEGRGTTATLGALFVFEVLMSFKQASLLGSPMLFAFAIIIGRVAALVNNREAVRGQYAFTRKHRQSLLVIRPG